MVNFSGIFSGIFSMLSYARSWIGQIISSPKTFLFIGLIAAGIILYLYTEDLYLTLFWMGIAIGVLLALWILVSIIKWIFRRSSSQKMVDDLEKQTARDAVRDPAPPLDDGGKNVQTNLLEAVHTIKTSKIGLLSGNAALYELPWYIVIGNPSAGKSSAITHSGLLFPLDKSGAPVKGVGGTRNCDWFFSTEGILLDTAGRYSTEDKDREEWLGFLDLLKRHRSKAPINGIIVAASISELMTRGPDFAIDLAKHLRQRVQEMTERLEVFAPVYIFFTKVDLLAGFTEFFANEEDLRNHPWGATFTYPANNEEKRDMLELFSKRFDELYHGLKEMSVSQIARKQTNVLAQGMLSFPYEFASIKTTLETFLATFFENNPYQYKPIFRGFYFTSALQTGEVHNTATQRLQEMFGLSSSGADDKVHQLVSDNGFFLKDLFSKIILADKQLVRQHASPGKRKWRFAMFFAMVAVLGLTMAAWSWSYLNNQQLLTDTQHDMDEVMRVQSEHLDMESRFAAMSILQRRIEQLDALAAERPLQISLGLYQGNRIKEQLLVEYYHGLTQFMIEPVKNNIESFLGTVHITPGLHPARNLAESSLARRALNDLYQDASPDNPEDVYAALKTYLMMADHKKVEPTFLADHVTVFWRTWLETNRGAMPREELIRSAQQIVSFYVAHAAEAGWPEILNNLSLVEKIRKELKTIRQGVPARDRVYATIKARSANNFPAITVPMMVGENNVDLVAGGYTVSGTFTKRAWSEFIETAFRDAAKGELQTSDWVLGTKSSVDLSLEMNQAQTFAILTTMYKKEYIAEWRRFLASVSVRPFATFPTAAERMNRLGHPESSPIEKLFEGVNEQTAWDSATAPIVTQATQSGITGWIKKKFGDNQSSGAATPKAGGVGEAVAAPVGGTAQNTTGMISSQFTEITRLLKKGENQPSQLDVYLSLLAKIRSRFNDIQNAGDTGPGTLQLLRDTYEGGDSPLSETMHYIDEQILTDLNEAQRATLRPLLVLPVHQAFASAIAPAEDELNKVWRAQVYDPFNVRLVNKYPFSNKEGALQATPEEIAVFFGPEGSIAHFIDQSLSTLVIRRGNTMTPRTWADMGIRLQQTFSSNYNNWIAPQGGAASGGGTSPGASGSSPDVVFMIQPRPIANATEYTIEIDGQQTRYRNQPPYWANFIWPNPQGAPGVKISATLANGQVVNVLDEPGRFGVERMIAKAQRTPNPDGSFNMSWSKDGVTIVVILKIISNTQSSNQKGLQGLRLPATVVGQTTTSR